MRPARASRQRGSSVFLVLIVLATLLLSGLALARMTDASTLLTGNIASRAAALQASEVAMNTAYTAVRGLANEASSSSTDWYRETLASDQTAEGLPSLNWDQRPSQSVGAYDARYFVERVCDDGTVTDVFKQCLLKQVDMPLNRGEAPADRGKQLDNPYVTQFRITVRVTDSRGMTVFVQALVTKGSV